MLVGILTNMYMIRTIFCLNYFYTYRLTQLPQYLPYLHFQLPIDYLPTVFRRKHDMVIAITFRMR